MDKSKSQGGFPRYQHHKWMLVDTKTSLSNKDGGGETSREYWQEDDSKVPPEAAKWVADEVFPSVVSSKYARLVASVKSDMYHVYVTSDDNKRPARSPFYTGKDYWKHDPKHPGNVQSTLAAEVEAFLLYQQQVKFALPKGSIFVGWEQDRPVERVIVLQQAVEQPNWEEAVGLPPAEPSQQDLETQATRASVMGWVSNMKAMQHQYKDIFIPDYHAIENVYLDIQRRKHKYGYIGRLPGGDGRRPWVGRIPLRLALLVDPVQDGEWAANWKQLVVGAGAGTDDVHSKLGRPVPADVSSHLLRVIQTLLLRAPFFSHGRLFPKTAEITVFDQLPVAFHAPVVSVFDPVEDGNDIAIYRMWRTIQRRLRRDKLVLDDAALKTISDRILQVRDVFYRLGHEFNADKFAKLVICASSSEWDKAMTVMRQGGHYKQVQQERQQADSKLQQQQQQQLHQENKGTTTTTTDMDTLTASEPWTWDDDDPFAPPAPTEEEERKDNDDPLSSTPPPPPEEQKAEFPPPQPQQQQQHQQFALEPEDPFVPRQEKLVFDSDDPFAPPQDQFVDVLQPPPAPPSVSELTALTLPMLRKRPQHDELVEGKARKRLATGSEAVQRQHQRPVHQLFVGLQVGLRSKTADFVPISNIVQEPRNWSSVAIDSTTGVVQPGTKFQVCIWQLHGALRVVVAQSSMLTAEGASTRRVGAEIGRGEFRVSINTAHEVTGVAYTKPGVVSSADKRGGRDQDGGGGGEKHKTKPTELTTTTTSWLLKHMTPALLARIVHFLSISEQFMTKRVASRFTSLSVIGCRSVDFRIVDSTTPKPALDVEQFIRSLTAFSPRLQTLVVRSGLYLDTITSKPDAATGTANWRFRLCSALMKCGQLRRFVCLSSKACAMLDVQWRLVSEACKAIQEWQLNVFTHVTFDVVREVVLRSPSPVLHTVHLVGLQVQNVATLYSLTLLLETRREQLLSFAVHESLFDQKAVDVSDHKFAQWQAGFFAALSKVSNLQRLAMDIPAREDDWIRCLGSLRNLRVLRLPPLPDNRRLLETVRTSCKDLAICIAPKEAAAATQLPKHVQFIDSRDLTNSVRFDLWGAHESLQDFKLLPRQDDFWLFYSAPRRDIQPSNPATAQRLKQIAIGKATTGYRNYIARVPPDERDPRKSGSDHPVTPDPATKVSTREFNHRLKTWRKLLYPYSTDVVPMEDRPPSPRRDL